MATFNYDLGQNWKLQQVVTEEKGKEITEIMLFYNKGQCISLNNESCQRLRDIFKQINK